MGDRERLSSAHRAHGCILSIPRDAMPCGVGGHWRSLRAAAACLHGCSQSSRPGGHSAAPLLSQQQRRTHRSEVRMLTFPSPWPPPPPPRGNSERRTAYGDDKVAPVSQKDTVTANEEDDEVDADDHSRRRWAPVCHDTVIHHSIPVFACQDLRSQNWD